MADFNLVNDAEESKSERIEVSFAAFNKEDYQELAAQIRTGQKPINISATATILLVLIKTLRDMIEQLNAINARE